MLIYDENGHGTAVVSKCCGNTLGSADAVMIVLEGVTSSGTAFRQALDWIRDRPWIDLVSISYGDFWGVGPPPMLGELAPDMFRGGPEAGTRSIRESGRPVFVGAGNGQSQGGQFNVFSSFSGPPWMFRVGFGGASGDAAVGPTVPSEVLGMGATQSIPSARTVAQYEERDGGTSLATTRVAGHAADLVGRARDVLGNPSEGCGCLAQGPAGLVSSGPLADGVLTADELLRAMMVTAIPLRPWTDARHGDTYVSFHPLEFTTYGLVNETSTARAWLVLSGQEPEPDRSRDDTFYDAYMRVRHAYWDRQVP